MDGPLAGSYWTVKSRVRFFNRRLVQKQSTKIFWCGDWCAVEEANKNRLNSTNAADWWSLLNISILRAPADIYQSENLYEYEAGTERGLITNFLNVYAFDNATRNVKILIDR